MFEQERNLLLVYWNMKKSRWPECGNPHFGAIGATLEDEINEEPKYVTETLRKHEEIFNKGYMHVVPKRPNG